MLLLYCHFTYYMTVKCQMMSPVNECCYCTVISHTTRQWSVKWCHLSMNVAIVLSFHILHDTVKCQMMSPVNECCYCTVISHTTRQWSVKWCHLSGLFHHSIMWRWHVAAGAADSGRHCWAGKWHWRHMWQRLKWQCRCHTCCYHRTSDSWRHTVTVTSVHQCHRTSDSWRHTVTVTSVHQCLIVSPSVNSSRLTTS